MTLRVTPEIGESNATCHGTWRDRGCSVPYTFYGGVSVKIIVSVRKCGVSWDTKTLLLNHTFSMVIVNQDVCVLLSKQAQRFGNLISFTYDLLCGMREGTVRSIIEKVHASASKRTVEMHLNIASLRHCLRNGLRHAYFYTHNFFW